jgi:hypothetical protein
MSTTIENATYTLTGVIDLRVWDEGLECWIAPTNRIPCAHCGRECQKVYEVTRGQDHKAFLIGPGCCRKNLFGWEPEQQVAREMLKQAEKLAKNAGHQRIVDLATPIAEQVALMSIPEIVETGKKFGHPAYGIEDISICCREGLTPERIKCISDGWKAAQVRILAASIENDKRREKVCRMACGMLLI